MLVYDVDDPLLLIASGGRKKYAAGKPTCRSYRVSMFKGSVAGKHHAPSENGIA